MGVDGVYRAGEPGRAPDHRSGFVVRLLAYSVAVFREPTFITVPTVLAMMGSAILMVFYLFLTEGRQKKAISGMFSTMVSPEVLRHYPGESGSLKLAGERMEATMFFSDVAGFTTISEKRNSPSSWLPY